MKVSEKFIYIFTFLIVLLFLLLIRLRLLEFPLERDEGEYAYMGQLILKGIPPYKLAYNMKWPGVYYSYAFLMKIFGETTAGIHLGFLVLSLASTLLIYLITKELYNSSAAFMAALTLACLSLSPGVLGFAAHATQFVMFFSLLGAYTIIKAGQRGSLVIYCLSGFLFGLAMIMKQHAFFFILFGVSCILFKADARLGRKVKEALFFLTGGIGAIIILFSSMYLLDVFKTFWFWTIGYAWSYEKQMSVEQALNNFISGLQYVTQSFMVFWILGLIGFCLLLLKGYKAERNRFVLLFAVCSALTVIPGFYFRPHYFITLIPAISILSGYVIYSISDLKNYFKWTIYGVIGISTFFFIYKERDYLFLQNPSDLSYNIYGTENSFPFYYKIAQHIQSLVKEEDKILVFGSEPEIYFYSNRTSATGYIYMYPFKEKHQNNTFMQQQMIREIETSKPKLIVNIHTPGSWGSNLDPLLPLLKWYDEYVKQHYSSYEVFEIQRSTSGSVSPTDFRSNQFVEILLRK